jgi:hypothetical protein
MEFELKGVEDWEMFSEYLAGLSELGHYRVKVVEVGTRTLPQNAALHVYCDLMAKALNDAGYEFALFLSTIKNNGWAVDWDAEKVKDAFRLIAKAQTGKESTAKLSTVEMQQAYEVFNRSMGELAGVSMPWPDKLGGGR